VYAASQLPQLLERQGELLASQLQLARRLGVALEPRPQHPQTERQRDEALLCTVMQVALEATARRVAGLDDPCSGGAQLLDLRAQLGVEPLVLEREGGSRAHGADELALICQRRVVDDCRHPFAV
jgi:hypothetical protein